MHMVQTPGKYDSILVHCKRLVCAGADENYPPQRQGFRRKRRRSMVFHTSKLTAQSKTPSEDVSVCSQGQDMAGATLYLTDPMSSEGRIDLGYKDFGWMRRITVKGCRTVFCLLNGDTLDSNLNGSSGRHTLNVPHTRISPWEPSTTLIQSPASASTAITSERPSTGSGVASSSSGSMSGTFSVRLPKARSSFEPQDQS